MPFITRLTVFRKKQSDYTHPGHHRRGEIISVDVVDALPSGPMPDHRSFAWIFITDTPDKFREGWLEFDNDTDALTFQVGEQVTGPDGQTGIVTAVSKDRLLIDTIIGDWPSNPGGVVTGSLGGSGTYVRHQLALFRIMDWLRRPFTHTANGTVGFEEADAAFVATEQVSNGIATATIDSVQSNSNQRMEITNAAGDGIVAGMSITGDVSGATAVVNNVRQDGKLDLRDVVGTFGVEQIVGIRIRNYVDSFGDPQVEILNGTATVVAVQTFYNGQLTVSGMVGGSFAVGESLTSPSASGTCGQGFEGEYLGRSARFIPISAVPGAMRDALRHTTEGGQNWAAGTFAQAKANIKLRPPDAAIAGKTDVILDSEGQTDVGAPG